jgi:hypothetical protein
MKLIFGLTFILSLSTFGQKLSTITWYKNNFDKLSNQLNISQFYSVIIGDKTSSTKVSATILSSIFEGYSGLRYFADEKGLVDYIHYQEGHFPVLFNIKRSKIYPLYLLQVVEDNRNRIEGTFLFDGEQLIYICGQFWRPGPANLRSYTKLSKMVLLNKELRATNYIEFDFDPLDPSQTSHFIYRMFSVRDDWSLCKHYENSKRPYKPELMSVYFELVKRDFNDSLCDEYHFEYAVKDPTKRIWYDENPREILPGVN